MHKSSTNEHLFWTEIGATSNLRFVTENSAARIASTLHFKVPFRPLGHTVASLR